jgi:hypothetical protein
LSKTISAIRPDTPGSHQFVVYGDSCSGIPGYAHEATTASINDVVARLDPEPEFVCFLGDEISGLTTNEAELRRQWDYWFEHEMAWLDRDRISLYHTTANHTTYDRLSESVYAEVMSHLPANGPVEQRHLSYFVRRENLLMVFVNTMWTGLGEGRVETTWLDEVLTANADAEIRLVLGHHPVFPINGFSGAYQRELEPENGRRFWSSLVRHGVRAYLCSHMLAFDTQVHDGILQIMTAGAGTKHRMPEEIEYLHAVQMTIDPEHLRYQVIDNSGLVREWLAWPPPGVFEPVTDFPALSLESSPNAHEVAMLEISGIATDVGGPAQTLVSAWTGDDALANLWIGLVGPEQRLVVQLAPERNRSPHSWIGPAVEPGQPFALDLMLHPGLGPGGILWRASGSEAWTSLTGSSAWGLERLPRLPHWSIGMTKGNADDRAFGGEGLIVRASQTKIRLAY